MNILDIMMKRERERYKSKPAPKRLLPAEPVEKTQPKRQKKVGAIVQKVQKKVQKKTAGIELNIEKIKVQCIIAEKVFRIVKSGKSTVVLHGPCGCGKTTIASIVAKGMDRILISHTVTRLEEVKQILFSCNSKPIIGHSKFALFRLGPNPGRGVREILSKPGYFMVEMDEPDTTFLYKTRGRKHIEYINKMTDNDILCILKFMHKKKPIQVANIQASVKKAVSECNGNMGAAINMAYYGSSEIDISMDRNAFMNTLLERSFTNDDRNRVSARKKKLLENLDNEMVSAIATNYTLFCFNEKISEAADFSELVSFFDINYKSLPSEYSESMMSIKVASSRVHSTTRAKYLAPRQFPPIHSYTGISRNAYIDILPVSLNKFENILDPELEKKLNTKERILKANYKKAFALQKSKN